jgi:hypothetical protein
LAQAGKGGGKPVTYKGAVHGHIGNGVDISVLGALPGDLIIAFETRIPNGADTAVGIDGFQGIHQAVGVGSNLGNVYSRIADGNEGTITGYRSGSIQSGAQLTSFLCFSPGFVVDARFANSTRTPPPVTNRKTDTVIVWASDVRDGTVDSTLLLPSGFSQLAGAGYDLSYFSRQGRGFLGVNYAPEENIAPGAFSSWSPSDEGVGTIVIRGAA